MLEIPLSQESLLQRSSYLRGSDNKITALQSSNYNQRLRGVKALRLLQ